MTIGVDLGATNIRAGLVHNGAIQMINQVALSDKDSLEKTLDQLKTMIAPLVQPGVKGIGIGVPSVVDIEKGIVYNVVHIPSWEKVELKSILEAAFKIPVQVNNDVNCFALGEQKYGAGKGYSSLVAIAMGTGTGSGIIVNNELYAGVNCGAGEIGCMPYLDSDYEHYTSSLFFSKKHNTTSLAQYELAQKGDAEALKLWEEFGGHFGTLIKTVLYAYDPQMIVLGGSLTKAYSFFEPAMRSKLEDFYFPESLKKLKIVPGTVNNIAILGASALIS
ncbi:MAG: ROK family protein [Chitinophagaceae bacterium]|nr:ROK family protein [Chitinophagaceae bacterium]